MPRPHARYDLFVRTAVPTPSGIGVDEEVPIAEVLKYSFC
jgi:hypothetical protein